MTVAIGAADMNAGGSPDAERLAGGLRPGLCRRTGSPNGDIRICVHEVHLSSQWGARMCARGRSRVEPYCPALALAQHATILPLTGSCGAQYVRQITDSLHFFTPAVGLMQALSVPGVGCGRWPIAGALVAARKVIRKRSEVAGFINSIGKNRCRPMTWRRS